MEGNIDVADLVVQMHSNIDSIHKCIQSLSDTKAHDEQMQQLESDREQQILDMKTKHEDEAKQLAAQRQKEAEDLMEQRRREGEEIAEKRRREDEERKARVEKEKEERSAKKNEEDQRRRIEMEDRQRSVQEKVEAELEKLEDEMEEKVEAGKKMLQELDEKRKAINAQIDAALNKPTVVPTIHFRSRARTRGGSLNAEPTNGECSLPESKEPEQRVVTNGTGGKPDAVMRSVEEAQHPSAENEADGKLTPEVSEVAPKEDAEYAEMETSANEVDKAVEAPATAQTRDNLEPVSDTHSYDHVHSPPENIESESQLENEERDHSAIAELHDQLIEPGSGITEDTLGSTDMHPHSDEKQSILPPSSEVKHHSMSLTEENHPDSPPAVKENIEERGLDGTMSSQVPPAIGDHYLPHTESEEPPESHESVAEIEERQSTASNVNESTDLPFRPEIVIGPLHEESQNKPDHTDKEEERDNSSNADDRTVCGSKQINNAAPTAQRPQAPQRSIQNPGFTESPATVLNTDDLFEDDDDDYDEAEEDNREGNHQDQKSPENPAHEKHENEEQPMQPPGDFASFVDTVVSGVPLVKHMVNGQDENTHAASNNHPGDNLNNAEVKPDGEYQHGTHDDERDGEHLTDHEDISSPRDIDSALHIRTHTADTVPSFETHAQSDNASSPTTPSDTATSPFQENVRAEPDIRSSWPANAHQHEVDSHEQEDLKPQASPLHSEFDPYNSQVYPTYITPKSSGTDLQARVAQDLASLRRESLESPGDVDDSQAAYSPHSSISPGNSARSRQVAPLDTTQSFSESRPYDSPLSAKSLHRSSGEFPPPYQGSPSPSRIPRRPTVAERNSLGLTPVNSPSIPSNTFFQKTRSLFESGSAQTPQSQPPPVSRPLSSLFTVNRSSPSPPRKSSQSSARSRPSSLYQPELPSDDDLIVPKSLDANPKPPSPSFSLPGAKQEEEEDGYRGGERQRQNPFLGGLSKLVGSGGLEASIYNPARAGNAENAPLLGRDEHGLDNFLR